VRETLYWNENDLRDDDADDDDDDDDDTTIDMRGYK